MHDLSVRIASSLLLSGLLLFVAFLFYSVVYPRRASAAAPSETVRTKDYGYLAPIARPIEWTVRQMQARVTYRTGRSSWGWAIVFSTLLVNLAMLPFRILAARNARLMKALQPQIDAINARYKRKGAASGLQMDPEQSREISEAYKEHKVNPLGGCIPTLAPLVVLAGFYSVLTGIAELHGAHWLWIADLAQPEQLPVRILPVLMIATQLLVGRITPAPAGVDPRMARIMTLMPLVFGIVLYHQPSALMLYWLTSNLLQLAQQGWLSRRYASN